jgi:hypothetical protein
MCVTIPCGGFARYFLQCVEILDVIMPMIYYSVASSQGKLLASKNMLFTHSPILDASMPYRGGSLGFSSRHDVFFAQTINVFQVHCCSCLNFVHFIHKRLLLPCQERSCDSENVRSTFSAKSLTDFCFNVFHTKEIDVVL